MALPRLTGTETILELRLATATKELDDHWGEVVTADRPVRLRWPEHHANSGGVRARPVHLGNAGVEVEVAPGLPERLGHPPALDEQQRHCRTQPLRSRSGHQRSPLLGG